MLWHVSPDVAHERSPGQLVQRYIWRFGMVIIAVFALLFGVLASLHLIARDEKTAAASNKARCLREVADIQVRLVGALVLI